MYADIKERWCDALKSGDYKQTTNRLRATLERGSDEVGYCCLGVLCELYTQEHNLEWVRSGETGDGRLVWSFMDDTIFLPPVVQKWAGLDHETVPYNPILGKPNAIRDHSAAVWNDEFHANFEVIAELIDMFIPGTKRKGGEPIDTYDGYNEETLPEYDE